MRLLLQHDTVYRFPRPAALGPHQIRLRPADHARARIETYALRVSEPAAIRWQRDPTGTTSPTSPSRRARPSRSWRSGSRWRSTSGR